MLGVYVYMGTCTCVYVCVLGVYVYTGMCTCVCVCGRCICSCGYVYHMCVGMVDVYVRVDMCTFVHTCVEVFPIAVHFVLF